jgi:pyruvate,water dikinase
MSGRPRDQGRRRLARVGAALACALLPRVAPASEAFSSVEPKRVLAGSWYAGATLRVRGSIDERSHVAVRVTGPPEHHSFNRRGKIGGIIWGGMEHVTFEHAPSLYAVYTSAALGVVARPAVRARLELGYETLEARMEVRGTGVDKGEMVEQFVRLKESEGLYRLAPGAVPLADAERGRRTFEVGVPLPATAAPGEFEVAVFELADGDVIGEDTVGVQLQRVGMPAVLFALAHEQGVLFGLLAVFALVATGVGVDLLGSRGAGRRPHPVVVMLLGLAREVDDAVLTARHRPRSPEDVERMRAKYQLFRSLVALNNELLEDLAELEEESSWTSFRHARVRMGIRALFDGTADMVGVLNDLTGRRYFDLVNVIASIRADVWKLLDKASEAEEVRFTLPMREIGSRTAGQVGDKAENLARIECDLGLRVPESFVVTVEAYREFLEVGGLSSQLRTILAPARLDAAEDFRRRCEMAQDLVREARIPPSVAEAIDRGYRAAGFPEGEGLAVRSSAAGEGNEISFAGQFESFLNVPASRLAEAWKKVVLSRFSPRAVFYRRAAGLADVDTPMAVLVQRLVRARASGVLLTRRPESPGEPVLLITSGPGFGPEVSAGIADADQFILSRGKPHRILERHIADKRACLVGADGGGLAPLPLPAGEQRRASISDGEAAQLATAALAVERYFGRAQDIEWVFDLEGQLFLLQARPIRADRAEAARGEVPADAPLLVRGGHPVWPGRAVGPVHAARTRKEEDETPDGSLLVVPQLLPDCVRLLPRVCGIVVERGTVTGHAASILREFRMPSLFGVPGALQALPPGQVVSLDVASRSVFGGDLWPELRGHLPVALLGRGTAGLPDLLAGKITKLSGTAFMGTWACQSLHDVIRFAHEMAIQAMFDIGDRLLRSPMGGVKALRCPPPVYVHVVDLGGGVRPEAASKESVDPGEILSVPFQGLWRGLSDPRFEPQRPERPGPFGSVLATTMVTSGSRELGAPNYACVTEGYLNLSSRQAYHFAIVDSFLSENPNGNHVSMRLRGGGAAPRQRNLRAEFAAEVLRLHHFSVSVTGDLMTGWVRGIDRAAGARQLATIGHLLRFLARLDMWMTHEADVKRQVDAFLEAEAEAAAGGTAGVGARPA